MSQQTVQLLQTDQTKAGGDTLSEWGLHSASGGDSGLPVEDVQTTQHIEKISYISMYRDSLCI